MPVDRPINLSKVTGLPRKCGKSPLSPECEKYRIKIEDLKKAQEYLEFDFEKSIRLGMEDKMKNQWQKYRRLQEQYFAHALEKIIVHSWYCLKDDSTIVGEIQQLLRNMGKDLLLVGKQENSEVADGNNVSLTIGAGDTFVTVIGRTFNDTLRLGRRKWLQKLRLLFEQKGKSQFSK